MESKFDKNHAQVLAVAIDLALPFLMARNTFTEDEENYLFAFEKSLLNSDGFSIFFNHEERNE